MALSNNRRQTFLFVIGCTILITGVLLHVPMLVQAHAMNNRLAGMPSDTAMIVGMPLIALGAAIACYGALPRQSLQLGLTAGQRYSAPASMSLNRWHAGLIFVLLIGLVIDVMKPATLGFVLPGLAREYGIERSTAALLPLAALAGTTVGSLFWGWLADIKGRRSAIVISTVLFVSTSVCGAMPTFEWNLAMCFLMGSSAGGMLPVIYTLLAEILPPRHRSWLLVTIGGAGLVGGYLAASVTAHLFEPTFGWRILWLQGFPTGLILLALARFIPESPQFLEAHGHEAELSQVSRQFGLQAIVGANDDEDRLPRQSAGLAPALVFAGLSWSFVNFGLLLWLPSELQQRLSPGAASALLAWAAALGLPAILIAAWSYSRLSSKWTLVATIFLTGLGLIGLLLSSGSNGLEMVLVTASLITGTNGTIATLLPFTAESYPSAVRARFTGLVAGSSKLGGVAIQSVALLGFSPGVARAAIILAIPTFASGSLLAAVRRRRQSVITPVKNHER